MKATTNKRCAVPFSVESILKDKYSDTKNIPKQETKTTSCSENNLQKLHLTMPEALSSSSFQPRRASVPPVFTDRVPSDLSNMNILERLSYQERINYSERLMSQLMRDRLSETSGEGYSRNQYTCYTPPNYRHIPQQQKSPQTGNFIKTLFRFRPLKSEPTDLGSILAQKY